MKGVNTLSINQATVMEAIEEYCNRRFVSPVKVTDFSSENSLSPEYYVTFVEADEVE
jgi:hypothetical protein